MGSWVPPGINICVTTMTIRSVSVCNLSINVCILNRFKYVYQLSGYHSASSAYFGIRWPCVSCPKIYYSKMAEIFIDDVFLR